MSQEPELEDAGELLSTYKSQRRLRVERGFRFLKSPDFLVSSLYLKKPERIEALLMVMTLCLMVYAAIQHRIRHALKRQSRLFPGQKKNPCQNPTARWVFFVTAQNLVGKSSPAHLQPGISGDDSSKPADFPPKNEQLLFSAFRELMY